MELELKFKEVRLGFLMGVVMVVRLLELVDRVVKDGKCAVISIIFVNVSR